jgi:hypothetical protein
VGFFEIDLQNIILIKDVYFPAWSIRAGPTI